MQILGSTGKASYAGVSYTEMRPISLLRVVFVGGLLISGIYLSFDVLPRLDIPPAVAIGALLAFLSNFFLQTWRGRGEREEAEALEMAREQDAALATYAEKLSELVTEKNLHERSNDPHVRFVAQALTTSLLRRLDNQHKRQVLELVYEMGLIEREEPLLDLSNASVDGANLSEFTLRNACLEGADLRLVNLYGADLEGTTLSLADLRGADLDSADLSRVNLTRAILLPYDEQSPARWSLHNLGENIDLSKEDFRPRKQLVGSKLREAILIEAQLSDAWLGGADLRGAKVRNADLTGTQLKGANLNYADLEGAKGITTEELEQQAHSLDGATLPDGQKYEEWLKSKGRGEEGENSGPS
jgi:uncharacterized protein YjbI with pentapeptide repeats